MARRQCNITSRGAIVTVWLWMLVAPSVSAFRRLPNDLHSAADEVFQSIHDEHNANGEHRQLGSVNVPLPADPDEHLVTSLPLLEEGVFPTKHWAGLLPASSEGDKYFFYWLFAPDTTQSPDLGDTDIPLLIWLNGGPGCSSMDGLFLENGPLRFELAEGGSKYQLVPAEHSWHKAPAYTLYIDQPVGTGLSFTTSKSYPSNDKEVNTDFYYFLQSFLKVHGDKFVSEDHKLNREFYFSGESHAGHYIPSMIAYILDQNEKIGSSSPSGAEEKDVFVGVSGAAIGNGWMDPFHQYAAAEAAYGHSIIGRAQMASLDEMEKRCQADLNSKRYTSATCFDLLDKVVDQSYGGKSSFKVSQYDARKFESKHGSRTFPPGHKTVETYLGGSGTAAGMSKALMQEVLEAIHATPSREAGQAYRECTDPPYNALSHQDGLGVVNEVVKILEHDADGEEAVRLLFFNGVDDLICNHVGNEILLEKLPWAHKDEWIKATRTAWKSKAEASDKISGYIKEHKNLLFLKVMESGHMVPMDVPEVALDMVRLFLHGGDGAFQYSPQNLGRSIAAANSECETCQVCPTNTTNYELDGVARLPAGASSQGNGNGAIWIGVALGAVALVGLFVYHRNRNGSRNLVASYDLEMRGGTYSDEPSDDGAPIAAAGKPIS